MKFGANQLRFEDLHYSLSDGYVATRLLFRLICNLPELSIRIFQSAYFLLLINRYVFRIADPYTLCCRIAYPPVPKIPTSGITNKAIVPAHADGVHYSCGSQATICSNKTQ